MDRQPTTPLRIVSITTAVAAGMPVLVPLVREWPAVSARNAGWLGIFVVFIGLFWALSSPRCGRLRKGQAVLLLTLITTAGLLLAWLGETAFGGVYSVLVAALLLQFLEPVPALVWLGVQTVTLGLAFRGAGFSVADTALLLVVFGSLGFFAFQSAQVALRERQAREALEGANAELRTARTLLAESVRANERLFVARELHDLMGHHLTALNLALEAAAHSRGPGISEQVGQARVLVKRLLLDLRRAVSTLRDESPFELETAVRRLAASATRPRVHVIVDGDLRLESPNRARAVLRCAQEVVTNALRHSGAENLWLELKNDSGSLRLRARDDGHGVNAPESGHGLQGMEERVEELNGHVRWRSSLGEGFAIEVCIPDGPGGS